MAQQSTEKPIMSKLMFGILDIILVAVALFGGIFLGMAFIQIAIIPSSSMEPTIHAKSQIPYVYATADDITYDDVILFFPDIPEDKTLSNPYQVFFYEHLNHAELRIKRVIGLPGDVIEVKDDFVWRNGEKVEAPYSRYPTKWTYGPYTVPEGTVFCMGDNRNNSHDSRMDGAYPANGVIGKVPPSWLKMLK